MLGSSLTVVCVSFCHSVVFVSAFVCLCVCATDWLEKFKTVGGQKGEEGRLVDAAPTSEELAAKPYTIFSNRYVAVWCFLRTVSAETCAHTMTCAPAPVPFPLRLCPFAHRAYLALAEKGLLEDGTVDYIHIDLGANKPAWYTDVNPSGTVPCVYQGARPVFESSVIVEYLDEEFPDRGTKLFPGDAVVNAKVRVFITEFNNNCIRPFYGLLMNKDPALDEEKKAAAREAIVKLDGFLAKGSDAGPYFLGDTFSAADVTAAPFIVRFVHTLGYYRCVCVYGRLEEPFAPLPRITFCLPFVVVSYIGGAAGWTCCRRTTRRLPASVLWLTPCLSARPSRPPSPAPSTSSRCTSSTRLPPKPSKRRRFVSDVNDQLHVIRLAHNCHERGRQGDRETRFTKIQLSST